MKKRIKVFETGNFPFQGGNYDFQRVKNIFGDVKDKIVSQFVHTSKAKGKEIILGEFDNFEVKEDGQVYADLEFNEKGEKYYEDGILEGISVEIPNDKLTKIACLPLGVKPAINGAEFQEETGSFIREFEVVEGGVTVDFAAILAFIVANKLTVEQISQIFASLKLQITDKEAIGKLAREFEKIELSEKEKEDNIRASIKAEFDEKEKKANAKTRANEFMEKNKLKINPGMKAVLEPVLAEFFEQENYEFESKKVSAGDLLERAFEKMPNFIKPGETEIDEFSKGVKVSNVEAAKAQWGVK